MVLPPPPPLLTLSLRFVNMFNVSKFDAKAGTMTFDDGSGNYFGGSQVLLILLCLELFPLPRRLLALTSLLSPAGRPELVLVLAVQLRRAVVQAQTG